MSDKHFILTPSLWLGEGKIAFSASPDSLKFYTKWQIPPLDDNASNGSINCIQKVEMHGSEDVIENHLRFYDLKANEFLVELENKLIGTVSGTGFFDKNKIAWEFRGNPNFEGFEIYELQSNGEYNFHAEYVSPDQFRSIIDGRIWKKEETKG